MHQLIRERIRDIWIYCYSRKVLIVVPAPASLQGSKHWTTCYSLYDDQVNRMSVSVYQLVSDWLTQCAARWRPVMMSLGQLIVSASPPGADVGFTMGTRIRALGWSVMNNFDKNELWFKDSPPFSPLPPPSGSQCQHRGAGCYQSHQTGTGSVFLISLLWSSRFLPPLISFSVLPFSLIRLFFHPPTLRETFPSITSLSVPPSVFHLLFLLILLMKRKQTKQCKSQEVWKFHLAATK